MTLHYRNKPLAILLAVIAFAPLLVHAAALDQFKSFVASTKAARGEFTQQQVKMMDGTAKVSNVSSGSFSFARPGKFIWTYLKPYEQLLQADGVPGEAGAGGTEADALYDQAVAIVLKNRKASISLVQRHLRIGYNRAARLLEQMEQSGLISTMQSNGNREILVPAGNNAE